MITTNLPRLTAPILLLLTWGWVSAVSGAPDQGSGPSLHTVQENESISDVAKRFLGDAKHVPELLRFNNIVNPAEIKPGMQLAVPGHLRTQALDSLNMVEQALLKAIGHGAEKYAQEPLQAAQRSSNAAQEALAETAYAKAHAHALLALEFARQASRMAAEEARIEEAALLTVAHGEVQLSGNDGQTWQPARAQTPVPVGSRIRTGPGSRAEIRLPDDSTVQVAEQSEFKLEAFIHDRRNNQNHARLRIMMGDVFGRIKPARSKESSFEIKAGDSATSIRGTELRVAKAPGDEVRVMTLSGHVVTEQQGQAVEVGANQGTVLPPGLPPLPARELPPPPSLSTPGPEPTTTGNQIISFAWEPVLLHDHKHPNRKYPKFLAKKIPVSYRLEVAGDEAFNQIRGVTLTEQTSQTSKILAPGTYFWRVATVDDLNLAGRWSATGEFTVQRDLALVLTPQTPTFEQQGQRFVSGQAMFEAGPARQDHSVAQIEFSLNDGPYQPYQTGVVLADAGETLIRARGIGVDGVRGQPVAATVVVDNQPPVVNLTATLSADGTRHHARLSAKDNLKVADIEYRVGKGPFTPYEKPLVLPARETQVIQFKARDVVGNESPLREMILYPDS